MIKFSCKLVGKGWIEAILTGEESEAKITASYLSDAPHDLIISVALLLEGVNETMCLWQEEPEEYRWLLKKDSDSIIIQILNLKQTFSSKSNENAQIVFSDKEKLIKFARCILREFSSIASEYTVEEYKNYWGYEFPLQALNRLRNAVKKVKVSTQFY